MSALNFLIDLVVEVVTSAVGESLDYYAFILASTPILLIGMPFLMLLVNILLNILFNFIPGLKRIVYLFSFPFRILHKYCHIWEIRRLQQKHSHTNDYHDHQFDGSTLNTVFFAGWGRDDGSNLSVSLKDLPYRDAVRIVQAPMHLALILAELLALLTGVILSLGELGLFIHFYITISCAGALWPDQDDYQLVYNILMIKCQISPFYLLFTVFIISYWFWVGLGFFRNLMAAMILGIGTGLIHIALLILVSLRHQSPEGFVVFTPDPQIANKYSDDLLVSTDSIPTSNQNFD